MPRSEADGSVTGYIGVALDITARKEAEERQLLLAREVDHRAKNLLAVVQSILQLSRADNINDFVKAVRGRVMALARSHSLLSESRWAGAGLRRLIEEELAPFRSGNSQIVVAGSEVILTPAAAQAVGIALHELATNAAKHGSLSIASGRLSVTWGAGTDGLELAWEESGGPPVAGPPVENGFGTKVIIASIEGQLAGRVVLDWQPKGLRAVVSVPAAHFSRSGTAMVPSTTYPQAEQSALSPAGRHIFVVEDEPLIAMLTTQMLEEIGCVVIGPASTLTQALQIAEAEQFDIALVDRNLAGQLSDPVARRLRERNIPFAVMTGYSDSKLPLELGNIPLLPKPFVQGDLAKLVSHLLKPRRAAS
jgi:two-component sensor histidine kinase/CheY-like chemotaxis protein